MLHMVRIIGHIGIILKIMDIMIITSKCAVKCEVLSI